MARERQLCCIAGRGSAPEAYSGSLADSPSPACCPAGSTRNECSRLRCRQRRRKILSLDNTSSYARAVSVGWEKREMAQRGKGEVTRSSFSLYARFVLFKVYGLHSPSSPPTTHCGLGSRCGE